MTSPLIYFLSLLLSVSFSYAQPDFRFYSCDNNKGNYTNTSSYAANLNSLLSTIASETGDSRFYNLASGTNSGINRVNGIAFCKGDDPPSLCKSCLSDAARKIRAVCPNQKEAIGWYNECMLRYSNRSIFATMESSPLFAAFNVNNASEPDAFMGQLGTLLRRLQSKAEAGDSRQKYAQGGPMAVSEFLNIYASVQCTPDLTDLNCKNCIEGLINYIPQCCYGKIGAIYVNPSCDIRYDTHQFFDLDNSTVPPPSMTPSPPLVNASPAGAAGKESNKGYKLAIAIVIPTVVPIVVIYCCRFYKRKKLEKAESSPSIDKTEDGITSIESLQFDFNTVREATNNFSDANKLGRGGFGVVYKGTLSNGQQIAVKRLAKNSSQGENEYKNEVLLVAKLQHRNLVRLLGFCLDGEERILIYEFLPNSSLDRFLFDPVKRRQLDWQTRYKIVTGIIRGLLYLHEDSQLRIIHRDLKASNVLLDTEMNAKISDFGMARLFNEDQTHGSASKIVGTYGYLAPEYVLKGLFSAKSDIYSFGVLVLEMISGKRSIDEWEDSEDLISCVWRNWLDGTPMSIVDESISTGSMTDIMKCIHIGLLCVQEDAAERPTMSMIVVMMNNHSFTLPLPSRPPFITHSLLPLDTVPEEHSSLGTMSNTSKSKSIQESVNEDSTSAILPR